MRPPPLLPAPLLLLAALAASAAAGAAAAAPRLVLRAACNLPDAPEAFRTYKHATELMYNKDNIHNMSLHVLGYEETCGGGWVRSVSAGVVSALSTSARVSVWGDAEGACGPLLAAAALLPGALWAPACELRRARAAAVSRLARAARCHRADLRATTRTRYARCRDTVRDTTLHVTGDDQDENIDYSENALIIIVCVFGNENVTDAVKLARKAVAGEKDAKVALLLHIDQTLTLVSESVDDDEKISVQNYTDAEWKSLDIEKDEEGAILSRSEEVPVLLLRNERTPHGVTNAVQFLLRREQPQDDHSLQLLWLADAGWRLAGTMSTGSLSPELRRWLRALFHPYSSATHVALQMILITVIIAVLGSSILFLLTLRWTRGGRRRRRRRDEVILQMEDFSFPVEAASSSGAGRVNAGMESMLSCWLQQLHEFGGPEPERSPVAGAAPLAPLALAAPLVPRAAAVSAPSSTCSVNRIAHDNRTRYKGEVVHLRPLPAQAELELKRKASDVLHIMQNLRHENLNPFMGILCGGRGVPMLVWTAPARGSLEDVLIADDIRLDWAFRLSLLTDLARALRHLHASPLRLHGRLSSRNCVVDARWVLRITDYGMPSFYRAQGLCEAPKRARDLLWTAPELLRLEQGGGGVPLEGTPSGDVYSFGIIMQEVIVRGEPYCMLSLTPEEIVEKVRRPPPLIRPSVSMGAAPPDAVALMRQCWSETAELRPDAARLYDVCRRLHQGRKTNIVDSMFEMLEKYSNNLEELVRERTEQLDIEKKKTEQLLNRMLPSSVAERLLAGARVEPEEFSDVTVYFSDIVGFTALAARSTPLQVAELLNELYTCFDRAIELHKVYKVETIGDAYMVVGGLPIRCADHACSVADMALRLLHEAGRFRIRHLPGTPLHLRSGVHSGPCCAAVVGRTMPRYCLFGDTVNTAARMESTGAAWRVQLSAATADRLRQAHGYRLQSRGLTKVKGKGIMYTYWLLGKDGFDEPLPTPPPLPSEEDSLIELDHEDSLSASPASPAPAAVPGSAAPSVPTSLTTNGHVVGEKSRAGWPWSGGSLDTGSPPRATPPVPAPNTRNPHDLSAPYSRYRCAGNNNTRVLRRQWSLERSETLCASGGGTVAGVAGAGDSESHVRYKTRTEDARDA